MNNPTLNLRQCMQEQTPLQTRSGDKAFVFKLNKLHPYPFTGVVITENNVFVYSWNLEGAVFAEKPHNHDIVGLWQEPAQLDIDMKKRMGERTYLKTRVGQKALILHHVPEDMYGFKGVIIYPNGEWDSATWSEDGKCSSEYGDNYYKDIVGLWEETDGR